MNISELKNRLENIIDEFGDTNIVFINLADSSLVDVNNLMVTMLPDGRMTVIISDKKLTD